MSAEPISQGIKIYNQAIELQSAELELSPPFQIPILTSELVMLHQNSTQKIARNLKIKPKIF